MCAPAVLQFSVQAFSIYAANATINQLINVQVRCRLPWAGDLPATTTNDESPD
jgi:hypothetical protein